MNNFFQGLSPSMVEGGKQLLRGPTTPYKERYKDNDDWVIMEGYDNNNNGRSSESSLEDSRASCGSTSSSYMVDDESSSSHSSGPLYELSELMVQLPIKRGLSKYFEGKSQSFTSLSRVTSIEDLAKKETPFRRKMKACKSKSYAGGLDNYRSYTLPKATISKKGSSLSSRSGSLSSVSFPSRRSGSCLGISRPPPIPVQDF